MLMPKRVKRRKVFRGRMKGKATRGNTVAYGQFGLMALEPCWIKSNQIEAARIAMTRHIKRGGKVWIKIFPDKPVSKKPLGTRMGSGKAHQNFGLQLLNLAEFFLKLKVFRKNSHAKQLDLLGTNFLAKLSL